VQSYRSGLFRATRFSQQPVQLTGMVDNSGMPILTLARRVWDLTDEGCSLRFLIHDHDSSFRNTFEAVFISAGFHVIHTPFQTPNANAYAKRWLRSAREECSDHILIIGPLICSASSSSFWPITISLTPIMGLINALLFSQSI